MFAILRIATFVSARFETICAKTFRKQASESAPLEGSESIINAIASRRTFQLLSNKMSPNNANRRSMARNFSLPPFFLMLLRKESSAADRSWCCCAASPANTKLSSMVLAIALSVCVSVSVCLSVCLNKAEEQGRETL